MILSCYEHIEHIEAFSFYTWKERFYWKNLKF